MKKSVTKVVFLLVLACAALFSTSCAKEDIKTVSENEIVTTTTVTEIIVEAISETEAETEMSTETEAISEIAPEDVPIPAEGYDPNAIEKEFPNEIELSGTNCRYTGTVNPEALEKVDAYLKGLSDDLRGRITVILMKSKEDSGSKAAAHCHPESGIIYLEDSNIEYGLNLYLDHELAHVIYYQYEQLGGTLDAWGEKLYVKENLQEDFSQTYAYMRMSNLIFKNHPEKVEIFEMVFETIGIPFEK